MVKVGIAMSAIIVIFLLTIGSTVQSVASVDIFPPAANSPCLNGSGYNDTQLSLLINTIRKTSAAVQLYPKPVDGRVLPGEEVAFLCCALVFGTGWSPEADWMINPQPSSNMNLFDFGDSMNVPVSAELMLIHLFYRTMRVNGSLDVNGTEIKCFVSNGRQHTSDPKELIVMGELRLCISI